MKSTLFIKNMVCPRCISAVKNTLEKLNIPYEQVELGKVQLSKKITTDKNKKLEIELKQLGFEILSSNKAKIISKIKTIIIQQVHHKKDTLEINFSDLLSQSLGYEYNYLSRLFSSVEGMTINRFIVIQKIKKIKELLFYDEYSNKEIADLLNYNSVAYLSNLFKKETGMTLTEFRELRQPISEGIDKI